MTVLEVRPLDMPTKSISPNRPRASRRISALFKALHAMYGAQWLDRWEGADLDLVRGQWAATLDRFDDACLKRALDSMLADGERFPPSLPEFFKRCSAFRPISQPGAVRLLLAGPRPQAPEGVFDKLRKQLQGSKKATTD